MPRRNSSVVASVNLHGTSPWHPDAAAQLLCSGEREPPRDKPVASILIFHNFSGAKTLFPAARSGVCRKNIFRLKHIELALLVALHQNDRDGRGGYKA